MRAIWLRSSEHTHTYIYIYIHIHRSFFSILIWNIKKKKFARPNWTHANRDEGKKEGRENKSHCGALLINEHTHIYLHIHIYSSGIVEDNTSNDLASLWTIFGKKKISFFFFFFMCVYMYICIFICDIEYWRVSNWYNYLLSLFLT